jgi:hypothetical protein
MEYMRKNLILPIKEDLTPCLVMGFQVNNLDKQQAKSLFTIMDALIKGCKITEASQDFKENHQYTEELVKRNII